MNPAVKINEPTLQPRFILLPPDTIDSRRSLMNIGTVSSFVLPPLRIITIAKGRQSAVSALPRTSRNYGQVRIGTKERRRAGGARPAPNRLTQISPRGPLPRQSRGARNAQTCGTASARRGADAQARLIAGFMLDQFVGGDADAMMRKYSQDLAVALVLVIIVLSIHFAGI
jgi:hypothetical protein